jgi:flagellar biosynthesis component FlhA
LDSFFNKLSKNSDLALALGLVMILAVMVIPMPSFFIDILLSVGIATSLVLMLTSVYATKALDFSVFPSLLLITTLFRLSLNVATTRVILLHGAEEGTAAAGEVIRSFGEPGSISVPSSTLMPGNAPASVITFTSGVPSAASCQIVSSYRITPETNSFIAGVRNMSSR